MNGQESHWFIRSSSRYKNTYDNGVVNYISGKCEDFTVTPDVSMGIAPAFNLDLSSVLLASSAVAGKRIQDPEHCQKFPIIREMNGS